MRRVRLVLALSLLAPLTAPGLGEAGEVRVERGADGSLRMFTVPGPVDSASRSASRAEGDGRSARPSVDPAAAADGARLAALAESYARAHRLDPQLVSAVIQVESAWNPAALSVDGAIGLMQLMPQTAASLAVRDPWRPEENLRGGTEYLRQMLDRFGRLDLALAGYNAGPASVDRYGSVPPYPETRDYVERVLRLYNSDPEFSLPEPAPRVAPKVYLTRDGSNRILLTTAPPSER